MKNRGSKSLIIVTGIWLIFITASAWWNIAQAQQSHLDVNLETARSIFGIIVTAREWNSRLGGVYAPISNEIQPNPYLDVPDRDVTTLDGQQLTKINPAYMTRLIAELAQESEGIHFHITSLNPIRPQNAPTGWERQALTLFEAGQDEYYFGSESGTMFNYMAPLITQESCLPCHEQQGYRVGDIRGGISVKFPTQPVWLWSIIISHILIGVFGGVLIVSFGNKLIDVFLRLEQQSEIDGLTQINNRTFFDGYFEREFLRARRIKSPLSILLCDIDSFKLYNDRYGHQSGDDCLKKVAQTLDSVLKRPGDLVARYGGEEFGIILPDTSLEGAGTVAELLRAQIEALKIPHAASKASEFVTISLGVATYIGKETSKNELLEKADRAMYQAKKQGKNIVSIHKN